MPLLMAGRDGRVEGLGNIAARAGGGWYQLRVHHDNHTGKAGSHHIECVEGKKTRVVASV